MNNNSPQTSKSHSKNLLIGLLKLAVVAVLAYLIFNNIDWRDTLTPLNQPDAVVTTGTIIGPWDAPVVKFKSDHGELIELNLDNQSSFKLVPGFLTYLKNMHAGWVLMAMLASIVSVTITGVRWWWFMSVNNLGVSMLQAQRYLWIGLFFNNFIPGQTGGDLVRAAYIVRHCHADKVRAAVSVFIDRVVGFVSLLLFGAIMSLFVSDDFFAITVSFWLIALAVTLTAATLLSTRVRRFFKLSTLKQKLPQRLVDILSEIDSAVMYYRNHGLGMLVWIIIGPISFSFAVLSIICLDAALGVGLPALDYFVLVPLITIVSIIPIAPNGWGIGEALYGALIGKFGAVHLGGVNAEQIMRTRGVALSVVFRIMTMAMSLVGGVLLFFEHRNASKRLQ